MYCDHSAANALSQIKNILSTEPVLKFFNPSITSVIQADASQHGLGACLLQQGKPIAYASHSLSMSEGNYAQIKKELLTIVFHTPIYIRFPYKGTDRPQATRSDIQKTPSSSLP